jgi:hypothetical protein
MRELKIRSLCVSQDGSGQGGDFDQSLGGLAKRLDLLRLNLDMRRDTGSASVFLLRRDLGAAAKSESVLHHLQTCLKKNFKS